jgi:uncharacterized protein YkwD
MPSLRVCAALAIACLASCTAPLGVRTSRASYPATHNETLLSNQILKEVNGYRTDRSKQALIHHAGLAALARTHAQYLRINRGQQGTGRNDANHHGFKSRSGKAQQKLGFRKVAENVLSCHGGSASTHVRLWSKSAPHEKTMIEACQYTGIGTVVDGDGMVFTVQLFGTKNRYDSRVNEKPEQTGRARVPLRGDAHALPQ